MQSGISVTPELHDAFTTFTNDTSLFCLPVTITAESLTPQTAVPFSSSHENGDDAAFTASLAQLTPLIEPKTPIYLLLRRSPAGPAASSLLALTYVPSDAPVRSKTLFASTRATLVRELGSEKFEGTVFATEVEEVVSAAAWRERDAEKRKDVGGGGDGGGAGGVAREDLMGDKERELEAVRRAVEERAVQRVAGILGWGGLSAEEGIMAEDWRHLGLLVVGG
ncbi:Actin monomer binding protein [Aspergillus sp. HF37]|nr:Actin monomer binding protein [Aspergillus sp. HF37]